MQRFFLHWQQTYSWEDARAGVKVGSTMSALA